MKGICILLLFTISFTGNSQEGYDNIRKAEKKIQSGQYRKALALLEKADSANYGFCGNAWASAFDEIALKRARIYKLQGKQIEAANAIWDVGGPLVFDQHDSLKVAYLIDAYGKEDIRIAIDRVIDSMTAETALPNRYESFIVYFEFSERPFEISYNATWDAYHSKQFEIANYEDSFDLFIEALRQQPFYQLLLEEN